MNRNREIKFRAWDLKAKTMGYDVAVYPNGYWMDWQAIPGGDKFPGYTIVNPASEKLIPMQFTGLKDKNGKEIYEGDIISYLDRLAPVRWDATGQWAVDWNDTFLNWRLPGFASNDLEVIGNIYENPELLK